MVVPINDNFLVESRTGRETENGFTPACVVMEFDNAALEYDPEVPMTFYRLKIAELVTLADALLKMADDLGVAR